MNKKRIKGCIALLLIVFLTVQTVDLAAFANLAGEQSADEEAVFSAETAGKDVTDYLHPEAIVLYDENRELLGDQAIRLDMRVIINYTFNFELEPAQVINEGDYALFEIPAVFQTDNISIPITDTIYNSQIATIRFTEGTSQVRIDFENGIEGVRSGSFYFAVSTMFSKDIIGDGGAQQIEFELNGEKIIIDIVFESTEMNIVKELKEQYIEAGVLYQDWRLTINQYQKHLQALTVSDVLPEGLAYHSYQFVDAADQPVSAGSWESVYTQEDNTVAFFHEAAISEETYLILTTYASDLTKWSKEEGSYTIRNTVRLAGQDQNGTRLDTVEDSADTVFMPAFLTKNGAYTASDGGIHWVIAANADKEALPQAQLVDTIPDGLTLKADTLVIYKEGEPGKVLTVGEAGSGVYDVTYTKELNNDNSISYVFSLGDISDCYYVEYLTEITQEGFYEKDQEAEFVNEAYLKWTGAGIGEFQTDRSSSAVKISNKWLNLFGSNHWHLEDIPYSEWHMVINESRQKVSGEVILDDYLEVRTWPNNTLNYGKYYQQVIEDSIKAVYLNPDGSTAEIPAGQYAVDVYTADNLKNGMNRGGFRITFADGAVSGKAVYVTFNSEISEETRANLDIMVTNTSPTNYKNTAELSFKIGSNEVKSTDSITVWASLRISEMYSDSYNYNTQMFAWRVHANESRYTGLGETRMEERLPEYNVYQYVEVYETQKIAGTYKVNLSTLTASGGSGSRKSNGVLVDKERYEIEVIRSEDYSAGGDIVNVTFADGALDDTCYAVIVYSKMAEAYYEESRPAKSFKSVSYIYAENAVNYQTNKEASRTVGAVTPPLTKTGIINRENGTFTWEIKVNGSGNYDLRGAAATDELQNGLRLDVESIVLYRYPVSSSSGGLGAGIKVDIDLNEWLDYDRTKNTFTFRFPDTLSNEEAMSCYQIMFDTIIEKDGTYSNNVSLTLKSSKSMEAGSAADQTVIISELGSGAVINRSARITLEKVNESAAALAGAVFMLKNEAGTILEEGESDSSGRISFSSWLALETKYYLEEKIPPTGYKKKDELIEVFIEKDNEGKAKASTQFYSAVNEQMDTAVLDIYKQDDNSNYPDIRLAGAKFQLYRQNANGQNILIQEGSTNAEGILTFSGLTEGIYTLKEVEAPDGYEIPEDTYVFRVCPDSDYQNLLIYDETDQNITDIGVTVGNTYKRTGSLQIQKKDASNHNLYLTGAEFILEYKTDRDGQYEVYQVDGAESFQVADNGRITIAGLPLGFYRLTEITAPRGYYKASSAAEFELTRENSVDNLYVEVIENEKITADINLYKASADGQALAGAEFTVTPFTWVSYNGTDRIPAADATLTGYHSDEEGRIALGRLPYGLYAIQEIKAPAGYQVKDEFLVVEVTHPLTEEDGDYRILYWDAKAEEDGSYTYIQRTDKADLTTIYNEETLYNLTVLKQDEDTGRGLAGAVFKITNKSTGTQVWNGAHEDGYFTTDRQGYITLQVPQGEYTAEEIEAPRGYYLSVEREQSANVPYQALETGATVDAAAEVQILFKNKQITQSLTFRKTDEKNSSIKNNKAFFNMYYLQVQENGHIIVPTLDDIAAVVETSIDGELRLDGLTEGFYILQERTPPEGYIRTLDIYAVQLELNDTNTGFYYKYYLVEGGLANIHTTDLSALYEKFGKQSFNEIASIKNEEEILYYDLTLYKQSEEGEPLAGAGFQLTDEADQVVEIDGETIFYTDDSGQLQLQLPQGRYTALEIQAPAGYESLKEPVEIDLNQTLTKRIQNKKKTISLTFAKTDKDTGEPLGKAQFGLYMLDVTVEKDDTLTLNSYNSMPVIYESSSEQQTLGELNLQHLSAGWYALQEMSAPDGYYRSLDIVVIYVYESEGSGDSLSYDLYDVAGGLVNINNPVKREATDDLDIVNEKLDPNDYKFELTIHKTSDADKALKDIVFGVYLDQGAAEPVYDDDGKALLLTTDEFGMATCLLDEGTYYLREESGAAGYQVSDAVIEITGTAQTVVFETIVNQAVISETDIILYKVNDAKEKIDGAVFNFYQVDAIFDENGELNFLSNNYFTYLHSVTSGDGGKIELGRLPYGFYALQEGIPAEGYVRNLETVIGIHVDEKGIVTYYQADRENHSRIEQINPDENDEITIVNEKERYTVLLQKVNTVNGYLLAGAEFALYAVNEQGEHFLETIKIEAAGEAQLRLPAGNYRLKETKAPIGYKLGPDKDFTVGAEGGSGQVVQVILANDQILADLEVLKVDEKGDALPGAVFGLYRLEVNTDGESLEYLSDTYMRQYTSGADGKIAVNGLPEGWYALQETTAPDGYLRNLDVLAFHITVGEDDTPQITYYDVFGGKVHANEYFERELKEGEAVLMRNEAEDAPTLPVMIEKINTSAFHGVEDIVHLSGAKFRIIQILESAQEIQITEGAGTDGLYTTDLTGRIQIDLPAGEYRIEEIKAPDSYVLAEGADTFVIQDEDLAAGKAITLRFENEAQGTLTIKKTDENNNHLEGVEFTLYRDDQTLTGDIAAEYSALIGTYKTDSQGEIYISNLRAGIYYIEESGMLPGFEVLEVQKVEISPEKGMDQELKLVNKHAAIDVTVNKVDKIERKSLSGAEFVLMKKNDEEVWVPTEQKLLTDENGKTVLKNLTAGQYLLEEVKAPAGYINDIRIEFEVRNEAGGAGLYVAGIRNTENMVTLENTPITGSVEITKVNDQGAELKNAVFVLYEQDKWLASGYTDGKGRLVFDNLSYGIEYTIKELSAPEGYLLSDKEYKVTITQPEQKINLEIVNEQIKGSITIEKRGKESGELLPGASFTLYNSKDDVQFTGVTGSLGVLTFADVPYGTYQLEETEAPEGYMKPDTRYTITVSEHGTEIKLEIANEKITGSVEVVKVDDIDRSKYLDGAVFELYRYDEKSDQYQIKIGDTYTTNADGKIVFEELSYGTYLLREVKAPSGYMIEQADHYFELTDSTNIRLIIKNTRLGSVKITKVDAADHSVLLNDVMFTLERSNENGEYVSWTDDIYKTVNGRIVIDNLPEGNYRLHEEEAAPGYLPLSNPVEFTITSASGIQKPREITVENHKISAPVVLQKVNNTGEGLGGAVFQLYQDADGEYRSIGEYVSRATDGLLDLGELSQGVYELVEIAPPMGYRGADGSVKITVAFDDNQLGQIEITDNDGNLLSENSEGIPMIVNDPVSAFESKGRVVIVKRDSLNQDRVLEGASFSLERYMGIDPDTKEERWIIHTEDSSGVYTTNEFGYIMLSLDLGRYRLGEIAAPSGYQIDEVYTEFNVYGDQTDVIYVDVRNTPLVTGSITIRKTAMDGERDTEGLEGAEFTLYNQKDETSAYIGTYYTDQDGMIEITGLALGQYTLIETKAPAGYLLPAINLPILIRLTEDEPTFSYTVRNEETMAWGTLHKYDAQTQQPMDNVGFALFYRESEADDWNAYSNSLGFNVYFTDSDGRIYLSGLKNGYYKVEEADTPEGYLTAEPYYFQIQLTEEQKQASDHHIFAGDIYIQNERVLDVELTKTDAKDLAKLLNGARFRLEKYDTGVFQDTGLLIEPTDENGTAVIEQLPAGNYRLIEMAAPDGYICSDLPEYFDIVYDEEEERLKLVADGQETGQIIITNEAESIDPIKPDPEDPGDAIEIDKEQKEQNQNSQSAVSADTPATGDTGDMYRHIWNSMFGIAILVLLQKAKRIFK